MAITNTKVFTKHLDGDINEIFWGEYNMYPTEYDKIAKMQPINKGGHYKEAELSGLGALREITEGNGVTFDTPVEGNEKEVTYTVFGLGFQITRQMMTDDLFGNMKNFGPVELAKSAALKRDTEFFDLFNSGFATHTAWDGQYVFDASGRTLLKEGSAQSNRPSVDASLSTTSLQAALEYFDTVKDSAGRPILMRPKYLVIPTQLKWTAAELLKTDLKVDSAENNINTIKDDGRLMPFVSRHLTSTTAWFILAEEHDMRFMQRWAGKLESADDFYTGNALFKYTDRFTKAVFNPVGGYGTTGA
jgi:phage major head subunit gpT-like protein